MEIICSFQVYTKYVQNQRTSQRYQIKRISFEKHSNPLSQLLLDELSTHVLHRLVHGVHKVLSVDTEAVSSIANTVTLSTLVNIPLFSSIQKRLT